MFIGKGLGLGFSRKSIFGGGSVIDPSAMRLLVDTTLAGVTESDQMLIPTNGSGYDCTINGVAVTDADIVNVGGIDGFLVQFDTPGEYEVTIVGVFPWIFFNNGGDKLKVVELISLGDTTLTELGQAFDGCSGITYLPDGLLDNASTATSLYRSFRNTNITSLPVALLANMPNLTRLSETFAGTPLTEIPNDMFSSNPSIDIVDSCFRNTHITSIPDNLFSNTPNIESVADLFRDSPIESIPANLFVNTPNINNINGIFFSTLITEIPADIFQHTPLITVMASVFYSSLLGSVPEGLFDNLSISSFYRCFRDTPITSIPTGLFSSSPNATSFNGCFEGSTIPTDQYSNLLIELESTNVNDNVPFHGGNSKYNAAGLIARDALVARGWTITDGGPE